jgi:hypothetical protein
MLKKIMSGGQTGADRAALDVAIKLKIPYGGWITKGRLTEEGPLPARYQLQEMETDSYAARTEQNVIDSDGTLIIGRGKLTGGTDYTREMALRHKKKLLAVDLTQNDPFEAASLITSWIKLYRIEVLNVAGPRASKDPGIYPAVLKILEHALQILINEEKKSGDALELQQNDRSSKPPQTVDEAIEILETQLPLKDKTLIANMTEDELLNLQRTLGVYIEKQFGLLSDNRALLDSCRFVAKDHYLHWNQASAVIIRKLWKKLQQTHKLRILK